MKDKKHSEYYPNRIAHQNQFEAIKAGLEEFEPGYMADTPYYCFMQNPERTKFLKEKFKDGRDEDITDYIEKEYHLWDDWQNSGSNIYHFSQELLEFLKGTDLSGIKLKTITLPYTKIYIDISEAELYYDSEKKILVEGVFVDDKHYNTFDPSSPERNIAFDFTGNYIENYLHINGQLMDVARGFHSYDFTYEPKVNNHVTVGEAAADAIKFFSGSCIRQKALSMTPGLTRQYSNFLKQTADLIINCLLYLSLYENEIEEKFGADLPSEYQVKLDSAPTLIEQKKVLEDIAQNGFIRIKYCR